MAQTEAAPAPTRGRPKFPPPPPPPWPPVPEPGGLPPIREEILPPICHETLADVASSKSMAPARRIKRRGAIPLQPPDSILEVPSLKEVIPRTVPKSILEVPSFKVTPRSDPHFFDWKAYNRYERQHPTCMLCEKAADAQHLNSRSHVRWTRSAEDIEHGFRWGCRRLSQHENRYPEPRRRPLEDWLK